MDWWFPPPKYQWYTNGLWEYWNKILYRMPFQMQPPVFGRVPSRCCKHHLTRNEQWLHIRQYNYRLYRSYSLHCLGRPSNPPPRLYWRNLHPWRNFENARKLKQVLQICHLKLVHFITPYTAQIDSHSITLQEAQLLQQIRCLTSSPAWL